MTPAFYLSPAPARRRAALRPASDTAAQTDIDEPELAADIEQIALDRITARIAEDLAGHGLTTVVTAILTAEGLSRTQAPPGPDGGIDTTAGRGRSVSTIPTYSSRSSPTHRSARPSSSAAGAL